MARLSRSLTVVCVAALAAVPLAAAAAFSLDSAEIKPNARIADAQVFNGFGCSGGNVSPSLRWKGAPAGTKSFAITVYDPDAPTGSGWWHWVVYNLPSGTASLPAGAGDKAGSKLPAGSAQGRTDFGAPGWGGPCPPQGDKPHRYIFTVHALKVEKLDVPADATAALVGFMINANRLGKASFTGLYGRK
jgi:Raf kinase inhibitor-like YbhB/YbcL family protein